MKTKRIGSLEGLRVIAIFVIVLSHLEFLGQLNCPFASFYNNHLHNATIGVDFFFIVSGFGLMFSFYSKPLLKTSPKLSLLFAIKKIRKLYPLVLISFLPFVVSTVFQFFISGFSSKELLKLLAQIFTAPSMLQSMTGVTFFSHALNGVVWFFSCLFVIYVFSPIIMITIYKHKDSDIFLISGLFFSFCVVILLSFVFSFVDGIWIFNDFVYGSPYIRIFYVVLGMLLTVFYKKIQANFLERKAYLKPVIFLVEFIIVSACAAWFLLRNVCKVETYLLRLVDVPLVALLVFVFSLEKGPLSKLLSTRFFTCQSRYVPYVYIIHYPVRITLMTFVLMHNELNLELSILCTSCIILITIVFAVAFDFWSRKKEKRQAHNG